VFLRLLATGKLYAADECLRRTGSFFPILKVIREEVRGRIYEYRTGNTIKIYSDDKLVTELPAVVFETEADSILAILQGDTRKLGASFPVQRTEAFMHSVHAKVLKAPSADKTDINMQLHDVNTGTEQVVGFSIKSDLGHSPTLLNAGRTTNFIYRIDGLPHSHIARINTIDTANKILDRITAIKASGGTLTFVKPANATFATNLMMIDSQMAIIIADMLLAYYSGKAKWCTELLKHIKTANPLGQPAMYYEHKVKELLCAVALGMKPATPWSGMDEAVRGYIVVKTDGDVLAYHVYNRNAFKSYLLDNTRLESGSTTRHEYATIYEESNEMFVKLNLQIRFK